MPTLSRYARIVAITAGTVYAVLFALANLVSPHTRTITEPVDSRVIREAGRPPAA